MNINNEMYSLFKTMMDGYKIERYDVMESAARCWLMFDPVNPFNPESKEYEAFFQMQRCFTIWRNGDINARINKKRMVDYAKLLCSYNPKQPYKFDKRAEEKIIEHKEEPKEELSKTEEPKKSVSEEPKKVVLEEPKKVLGVPPEEKKNWFRFLFPWKKEGESNDGTGLN